MGRLPHCESRTPCHGRAGASEVQRGTRSLGARSPVSRRGQEARKAWKGTLRAPSWAGSGGTGVRFYVEDEGGGARSSEPRAARPKGREGVEGASDAFLGWERTSRIRFHVEHESGGSISSEPTRKGGPEGIEVDASDAFLPWPGRVGVSSEWSTKAKLRSPRAEGTALHEARRLLRTPSWRGPGGTE